MKIILASKSPRRKEILEKLNLNFEIIVSDCKEESRKSEVCEYVKELSLIKAESVKKILKEKGEFTEDTVIIGCDTVVSINNKILGKPKNREDAYNMIKMLSAKDHNVVSGLTLIVGEKTLCDFEMTTVTFDNLSDEEIEEYILTNEPYDKAGGYAIQGYAARFVKKINGCYYNVVGLPVYLLKTMAKKLNIKIF